MEAKSSSNATSSITINGTSVDLEAPPLDITYYWDCARRNDSFFCRSGNGLGRTYNEFWVLNQDVYSEVQIKQGSRCLPNDADSPHDDDRASTAYSWGFSSFLFLIFCIATLLFAVILVLLQLDVYFNSRSNRNDVSHNTYSNILMLADQLRQKLGHDIGYLVAEHLRGMIADLEVSFHHVELEGARSPRLAAWKRRRATKTSGNGQPVKKAKVGSDEATQLIDLASTRTAESQKPWADLREQIPEGEGRHQVKAVV